MKRRSTHSGLAAVTAIWLLCVLSACGSGAEGANSVTDEGGSSLIATSPTELAQQAGELRSGGVDAFKAQLAALKGVPVVVNQWASWCGPCRYEFPFFASQATKLAGKVAFIGVDSKDSSDDAKAFLKANPVPYPSFEDQDGQIARLFRGGRAFPTTAFYDANGKLTESYAGSYPTEAKLAEDIERYATQ